MTLKRLVLGALTILAIVLVIGDLVNSWSQPQFNSRLELYETDLQLQASEWQGNLLNAHKPVSVDDNPVKSALESYQKAQKTTQKDIVTAEEKLEKFQLETPVVGDVTTTNQLIKQKSLLKELDLRVGVLQAQQGQVDEALKTWATVKERSDSTAITAQVLSG
ncbi:MAG: CPBP family intramembrane metalloprotease domain-containing protein, partial [Phormidesmis sp. CAN_BIN36]|nr:CPBP family intramembrane metalloprotease domain-containing protein [Phormidesmis sp. CAN_BIN36]